MVGFLLVGMGVLTYYFAPLSFIYKNYTLFFMILNFVLILMILGLAFLSLILLPTVQRYLVKIFLFVAKKDKVLENVIMKNLQNHEKRNTKTAMMFVIALSFLIFAGSIFELMGRLIVTQLEMTMGKSDIYANSVFSKTSFLDEGAITGFLEEQKSTDGAVESYTWASTELRELLKMITPSTGL